MTLVRTVIEGVLVAGQLALLRSRSRRLWRRSFHRRTRGAQGLHLCRLDGEARQCAEHRATVAAQLFF